MNRLLPTLPAVLLLSLGAFAQGTNPAQGGAKEMTLTGAVYDANGAVIVESKVVARHSGGKVYEARVNDLGFYTLLLPLGIYRVEARSQGFYAWLMDEYRVVDATHGKMSLDFVLEAGPPEDSPPPKVSPSTGRRKPAKIHRIHPLRRGNVGANR